MPGPGCVAAAGNFNGGDNMMSAAQWLKIGGALQNALVLLNELEEDTKEGIEHDMARRLGRDGVSMLARVTGMLHTEYSRRAQAPCRRCGGGKGVTINGQICGLCLSA